MIMDISPSSYGMYPFCVLKYVNNVNWIGPLLKIQILVLIANNNDEGPEWNTTDAHIEHIECFPFKIFCAAVLLQSYSEIWRKAFRNIAFCCMKCCCKELMIFEDLFCVLSLFDCRRNAKEEDEQQQQCNAVCVDEIEPKLSRYAS